ncbi:MAG: LytTR family DNA-binding domain-containing protein [Chitinophagales bacterium]
MNALIVDDEPLARENLRMLLAQHCSQVKVVAECRNDEETMEAMETYKVQVVFLDIEMPGKTGIQIAADLHRYQVHIVFVTAYNEYAIRAFQLSAIDYLLKPISTALLQEAVARCERYSALNLTQQQLQLYNQSYSNKMERIALPSMSGLDICFLKDIVCFAADESYTEVMMADNTKKIISRKLGAIEETLGNTDFIRVHKSYLINIQHVKRYIKGEGGQVELSNGLYVDVARRKKDALLEKLHRI